MARKNTQSTSSIKKFTNVPPTAQPAGTATTSSVATLEAVKPTAAAAPVTAPAVTAVKTAPVVAAAKPEIAPLLAALHDIDADVAREAATSLGQSGDASAVAPLIEIVSNTNGYYHSVVRSAAAASLGKLKDRRAVEALLTAVSDPIADPSTEAVHALTALADPRAIAKLVEVVRNADGFFANSVRRAAVLGLTKLGGDTANAELRVVAADEQEDSVIRAEAAEGCKSR